LLLGAALVTLGGCRPLYVARLGIEHLRYVSRARPIDREIAETNDDARRNKLLLVLEVRDFAERAGLDVGGSYRKVASTKGLATAYVVTAAYPDRLEPYSWSYPVIGRVPYRGYFERDRAEAYAEKLRRERLDTYIVEATGYSTLGWFDDPLPSAALALDEVELAGVVLHELVHQTLFVPGHIDFNETLASAAGQRLAIAFFEDRETPSSEAGRASVARAQHERWLEQCRVVEALGERLQGYFDQVGDSGAGAGEPASLLEGRRRLYAAAMDELLATGLVEGDAADLADRMNNAVFLALRRYRRRGRRIDAFLGRFASVGAALEELGRRTESGGDPYEALAE